MVVGDGVFKTKTEAETGMKSIKGLQQQLIANSYDALQLRGAASFVRGRFFFLVFS